MTWIYEAVEVIATVCEDVLILWFLSSFFGFKPTVKRRFTLSAGFVVLMTVFFTVHDKLLPNENFISSILYTAFCFLFCCFLKGKWISHLFLILVADTLLLLVAVTINSTMAYFTLRSSIELASDRSAERVVVLICSKLMLFLACEAVLAAHKIKPDLRQTEWAAFAVIFFSILLTGLCVFEMQLNDHAGSGAPLFPLTVLCLLVICLVSFYMLSKISKEHRENMKASLLMTQLREQEHSIAEMKNVYGEMRKIRHNIKEQYGCLQELLISGKYEQAREYLSELKLPDLLMNPLTVTDNDMLNAILSYLSHKCGNSNVKLICLISSNDIACFSAADISVILTNLVSNSLESCVKSSFPEIKLELYEQKNYFCISVKNPITESVLETNPLLVTTKRDKDLHGFGVESVKLLAEKYNGITNFREDGLIFIAEVWLKRPVGQKSTSWEEKTTSWEEKTTS